MNRVHYETVQQISYPRFERDVIPKLMVGTLQKKSQIF